MKGLAMNIDEALRALCEKHGLERIDVGVNIPFGTIATVWWDDSHSCATGHGGTCAVALGHAIHKVNEVRAITPEVPALEIEA